MLIVQKYGGSSVADKAAVQNAASRIAESFREGNKVVVVVSAQGNTTDELLKYASDMNPEASERELDMILSTGEQLSAALMAITLNAMNIPAISLNAWQLGIVTTENYGNAKIEAVCSKRIKEELEKGNVVIAAGFQGINKNGDITTLGRGGSDTTAVALAAALEADKCEIYTDVDGVFTADPRVVKDAVKLKSISYEEMLDYTTMGAKVLHNRSVELAKRYNVPLTVRSSFSKNEGTSVCAEGGHRVVSGIASDKNTALISITEMDNIPGAANGVFSLLAKKGISVDIILCSGTGEISFTVAKRDMKAAVETIKGSVKGKIETNDRLSKVSVIGAGLETNPGVVSSLLEAIYEENINIEMITTSEIKISLLIDKNDEERAVRAIHNKFIKR